jgi:hypothetical protein
MLNQFNMRSKLVSKTLPSANEGVALLWIRKRRVASHYFDSLLGKSIGIS